MNNFEEYLVELLQGNIIYEGEVVPLRKQFGEHPQLPLLTLDTSMAHTTERVSRTIIDSKHDVHYHRLAYININLWCNTEEERDTICDEVMRVFYEEQSSKLEENEESLTEKHGIVWGTVNIEPPFSLDEVEEVPPLLRSIFKCEASYIEEYHVPHTVITEITTDVDEYEEE